MSQAIDNLLAAQERAMKGRPDQGGFPYLAETLRQAGVTRNVWQLPSCQSIYVTQYGSVVQTMDALVTGATDVPPFDERALIAALRIDQAGKSTFPEFLEAAWNAGIVQYDVDFVGRSVTYYGCMGEQYVERYPDVSLDTVRDQT